MLTSKNLILLCKEHHKCIDSDENYYTIEKLLEIKMNHENWVRDNLKIDYQQQKDDELFADYIDQIQKLANFDNWLGWTIHLLGGHFTKIDKQQFNNLIELHRFIRGREFPKSKQNLIDAIDLFNLVLEDFINEFEIYNIDDDDDEKYYHTKQLYRTNVVTPEKQDLHEFLLEELIIELTKAGNYLFNQIRQSIFPTYRFKEGNLILNDAPIMGFSYRRYKYEEGEKYGGLSEIKERTKIILQQY
jgi:hypothetical protein